MFDEMTDRDVVSWTTILMAYVECEGCAEEMMRLFNRMLCSGTAPNCHTVTVVLKRATLELGMQLHGYIVKNGWDSDEFVGSCLIDFYAKSGFLRDVQLVFDKIKHRDVVCYNALMSSYGRIGFIDRLVSAFLEMGSANFVPSRSTFIALLNGCANFGLVGYSSQFHGQSIVRGFHSDENIQGVIVDMYSKCGDLEAARRAFKQMSPTKNVVAWNSMIGGYGKHGRTREALWLFDLMRFASVLPDHITFTLLLSTCSHSGLVSEGLKLFTLMTEVYRIPPRSEHYCCMVDLLGRAGLVEEAYELLMRNEKCALGASAWSSLLASCRVWGDADIGQAAARRLFEIDPGSSGSYIALASIFASNGQWSDAVEVRELMGRNGVRKDAGRSWIEVGGATREFKAGEGVECSGSASMTDVYLLCESLNSSIRDWS